MSNVVHDLFQINFIDGALIGRAPYQAPDIHNSWNTGPDYLFKGECDAPNLQIGRAHV